MNARKAAPTYLGFVGAVVLLSAACTAPRDLGGEPADEAEPAAAAPGSAQTGRPVISPPPGPAADGPIYVHGPYTLYKFEPRKAELTPVGEFDCLLSDMSGTADSGMHDLAVDSSGRMYGVGKIRGTSSEVFNAQVIVSIDKQTGHCKKELILDDKLLDPQGGLELRGLSFVPQGTLSQTEEALVALEIYGAYIQIDLKNQQAIRIGSLNGNVAGSWKTKGADIVSIIGDETYSTAQGPQQDERLIALDPRTGQVKRDLGSLGNTIFGGLAYWGGTLYGFTVSGRIFAVDPSTARTTEILIKAPADTRFDGAAVTPSAPILPPG